MPEDLPGTVATTAIAPIGTSVYGSIETIGDHDWYAVQLEAGKTYEFRLHGVGLDEITDTVVTLHDADGNAIDGNDDSDSWGGANQRESRLVLTASESGTYYLDAATFLDGNGQPRNPSDATTGDFLLSAVEADPDGMVFTPDEIAWQLTNNGMEWFPPYGKPAAFDLGSDGALTVNLTTLTTEGQTLARAALQAWSDVSGIAFVETSARAEINFDDNGDFARAYSELSLSGKTITSANVVITAGYLADYGASYDSYS